MHEMVVEDNTEQKLKKGYVQVGEHLYIKKLGLELEDFGEDDKKDIQIVFSMGGKGTRLRHITKDKISKHLIDVNGKALSSYVVDSWVNNGFDNLCILTDDTFRGDEIREYYKDGDQWGVKINYSIEKKKLASGGAMRKAIDDDILDKSFINHYPDDVIINYPNFANDFAKIFISAIKSGYQCVVLCVPGKRYPYGVVEDEDGRVTDFIEKPFINKDSNTGIFGISEDAFPLLLELEPDKEFKIERTVLKELARMGKILKVLLPTECWIPVNDEPNMNKLIEILNSK